MLLLRQRDPGELRYFCSFSGISTNHGEPYPFPCRRSKGRSINFVRARALDGSTKTCARRADSFAVQFGARYFEEDPEISPWMALSSNKSARSLMATYVWYPISAKSCDEILYAPAGRLTCSTACFLQRSLREAGEWQKMNRWLLRSRVNERTFIKGVVRVAHDLQQMKLRVRQAQRGQKNNA
jgi:hypothetical protein